MAVIIGVDPHKASHTAVAIGDDEDELGREEGASDAARRSTQLLAWAEPFEQRTWAIESAGGLGYLLAQQLVAAGEDVVDVPATLASRVRVLGTGRSNKNDPNDALSVAVAALRAPGLRQVARGRTTARCCACWRNATPTSATTAPGSCAACTPLLVELAPGGIAKEINASDVDGFLAASTRPAPVERVRYDLAVELLDDIRRLDAQLKASHKRIRDAVARVGHDAHRPVRRRPDHRRDRSSATPATSPGSPTAISYAAYNGTAPVEFSSGGRVVHRLSPTRQPPAQPRPPHGRDLPDPPTPLRRPRLLRSHESPRARPRRKRSARSSATSATPSTASSSPTPPRPEAERAREDKRERL